MSKYIDAEKLIAAIERRTEESKSMKPSFDQFWAGQISAFKGVRTIIASLQHEHPEENKLPDKRSRVNYAIYKLESFKPLREAIVLDGYVHYKDKCYRENLLNYIHAIPENRLAEIRHYLKENRKWPYDDDADWVEQVYPDIDLAKFTEKIDSFTERYKNNPERVSIKGAMAFMARMFYQYPSVAREWYENLPKATMD